MHLVFVLVHNNFVMKQYVITICGICQIVKSGLGNPSRVPTRIAIRVGTPPLRQWDLADRESKYPSSHSNPRMGSDSDCNPSRNWDGGAPIPVPTWRHPLPWK